MPVFRHKWEGPPCPSDDLRELVQAREFEIRINLNLGSEDYVVYTTDLSPEYVDFNR